MMLPMRPSAGQVTEAIAPNAAAYRIRNFTLSDAGAMRTIRGPVPYVPNYGAGYPSRYGRMWGVYHCWLGEREILLLHSSDKLLVHRGYNSGDTTTVWEVVADGLPTTAWAAPPTQFLNDGRRIVICIGKDQPLYSYDGETFDVLGFSSPPSAPSAVVSTERAFGGLGTAVPDFGSYGGILPGGYVYHVMHVDLWGDVSPASAATGVSFDATTATDADVLSALRKTAMLSVPLGLSKVRQRRLFRSPDRLNSGSIVPQELYGSLDQMADSAAIPDNSSDMFVDSTPDAYLGTPIPNYRTTPRGTIICLAFGRLWVAGVADEPGLIYYSEPGLLGTFGTLNYLLPDPRGRVVAMVACPGGLLVLTDAGGFKVVPSQTGGSFDFQAVPVPGADGCLALGSVQTLSDGSAMWLGRGGFLLFDGQSVQRVGEPIRKVIERLDHAALVTASSVVNPKTGEYRCAVNDGSTTLNELVLCYRDGVWSERTELKVSAMCDTFDHRGYVLVAGASGNTTGLWVTDHAGYGFTPTARTATYESTFVWPDFSGRFVVSGIILIMREGSTGTGTLTTYKDGNRAVVDDTVTFTIERTVSDSPKWGTAIIGDSGVYWHDRPVYEKRVHVDVQHCSSFAWKLETTGDVEIVAWSAIISPSGGQDGSQIPE